MVLDLEQGPSFQMVVEYIISSGYSKKFCFSRAHRTRIFLPPSGAPIIVPGPAIIVPVIEAGLDSGPWDWYEGRHWLRHWIASVK
jgi:hypothetical protein